MYDFRLGEVAAWIKSFDARTVAIQMPEGLKIHAQRVARQLEADTGATFLIVGDPCYGACDYTARYASYADALVQFGHSEIPSIAHDPKVLFVEVFVNLDISELLEKALPQADGPHRPDHHRAACPDASSGASVAGIPLPAGVRGQGR